MKYLSHNDLQDKHLTPVFKKILILSPLFGSPLNIVEALFLFSAKILKFIFPIFLKSSSNIFHGWYTRYNTYNKIVILLAAFSSFLSASWLLPGQLWATVEGTASPSEKGRQKSQVSLSNHFHETVKYWVGVQWGQSCFMGRSCLFSLG